MLLLLPWFQGWCVRCDERHSANSIGRHDAGFADAGGCRFQRALNFQQRVRFVPSPMMALRGRDTVHGVEALLRRSCRFARRKGQEIDQGDVVESVQRGARSTRHGC